MSEAVKTIDHPREEKGSIDDYKGFDWKNATDEDIVNFGKTLDFPERGLATNEGEALVKALHATGHKPLTIFETGMGYGTSTRIFVAWTLKYGGEVHTCEHKVKPLFVEKMKEAGYWKYVNLHEANSQKLNWQKPIDFLFIDSEHSVSDALGEYMKYRIFLRPKGIVGFHDTESCGGVRFAIQIAGIIDMFEIVAQVCNPSVSGIRFFRVLYHNYGGSFLASLDSIKEQVERIKRDAK